MSQACELFDPARARALDAEVAATTGDGGWDLMCQAGAAAWAVVQREWPQARRLLVLCGPGNNGGDALMLACLARAAGCRVAVVCVAGQTPRTPLARRALEEWGSDALTLFDGHLPEADLVIDGLFGLGLARAPGGGMAALIEAVNARALPVLALDVPSGVDARTGAVPGVAIRARRTLMFLLPHLGLHTGPALERVGARELAPLALPPGLVHPATGQARLVGAGDLAGLLAPRRANTHKGESGHVLVVGGNHGTAGAVALCGEAALRSGAGLVTVATRAANVPGLLARCPELMTRALGEVPELDADLAGRRVLALGPGLGQDAWGRALYDRLRGTGRPRVLDADALNLLAADPQPVPGAVITPHPGEAARLLGVGVDQVQSARLAALTVLVERYRCVVVLKGAGTLVGGPGARPWVLAAGNPGMAVGGMGDVLTGVIAALLAQGLPPLEAARAGALIHSVAGDRAAGSHPRGLIPTDLLPHLRVLANPEAVR